MLCASLRHSIIHSVNACYDFLFTNLSRKRTYSLCEKKHYGGLAGSPLRVHDQKKLSSSYYIHYYLNLFKMHDCYYHQASSESEDTKSDDGLEEIKATMAMVTLTCK